MRLESIGDFRPSTVSPYSRRNFIFAPAQIKGNLGLYEKYSEYQPYLDLVLNLIASQLCENRINLPQIF